MALFLPFIPAAKAHAGVFISVGFAPPVLPVYVQPPCPEPGLMVVPGYWAYGDDGYYWVPGAWVPAPYEGALWTPPYWGWSSGLYVFHPGYWGTHVGYYGGVNYGFGYMGIGFVGGAWHGHDFAYNTAIVNVNRTVIRNVYVDKTVVVNNTVVNNNHIAYSGGPGGINHQPTAFERQAMGEKHLAPTQFQEQHVQAARSDHSNYFNANHGHPQQMAVARPLQAEHHDAPAANIRGNAGANGGGANANARGEFRNNGQQGQPQNQRPAFQQTSRTRVRRSSRSTILLRRRSRIRATSRRSSGLKRGPHPSPGRNPAGSRASPRVQTAKGAQALSSSPQQINKKARAKRGPSCASLPLCPSCS